MYGYTNTNPKIAKLRRRVGAVIETPSIYNEMTAIQNLKEQYQILGIPDDHGMEELLSLVGIPNTGKKKVKNFSMLLSNKAACAVICVISAAALLFAAVYILSRLEEPEYFDGYVYTDSTGTISQEIEANPNYLSGMRREVYQFALDFLPTGQVLEINGFNVLHPVRLILCSLFLLFVPTLGGLLLFRRKDIK